MNNKRIAFVLYDYPLGVSSMIINSIRMFTRKGFKVDIYINKTNLNASPIKFPEERISIVVYDDTAKRTFFWRGYRFLLRKIVRFVRFLSFFVTISRNFPFNFCLLFFYPDLFHFSRWLGKKLSLSHYTYFMPVECNSILCLYCLKEREKIVYYNMELLDWSAKNPLYAFTNKVFLKNLEYRMIKSLSHVVIQSPHRAKLFSKINDFDVNKIYLLPITSIGKPVINRSDFFRDMFNIPSNSKIAVYAGNFNPWFECLEIIKSVKKWPKGYALVMHTWNKTILNSTYYQEMKKQARGLPIYFSVEYVDYDEMATVLSSADIGLMFYKPIDSNFTEILFSSNKLAEYLKAGLPIICSNFSSLKSFIDGNAIGATTSSIDDLPHMLELVNRQINILRRNVLVCYQKKFRFERYFDNFYRRLVNSKNSYDSHFAMQKIQLSGGKYD